MHTTTAPSATNKRPSDEFLQAFLRVKRPYIVGHVTPDSDCLGSSLGLACALREQGIGAVIGMPAGSVTKKLDFMFELAPETPVIHEWAPHGVYDALVAVDTASDKRINVRPAVEFSPELASFNIDHHMTNTDFARHNWVDPHASSTSELIARLIRDLGWTPSARAASLLFAGIHGDTAGFSLPNTTAESLQAAADLVRWGADVTHIGERLLRSQGKHDFELLRRVYDHTTVTDEGAVAYSYLSYADITESGCAAEDIDDQVSIPRALRGVRIALLFTEGEPGVVRINLRGEGKVTVLELAQRFGGGGHSQSAGVRVKNRPMGEVIEEVVAAAEEYLQGFGG